MTLRVENVGPYQNDIVVAIANRTVFHSVSIPTSKDTDDDDIVELICQAPRVDHEGFQPICVRVRERETLVDNILYYAKLAPRLPDVETKKTSNEGDNEPISMAELDDIDAFLESDTIAALTTNTNISKSDRSWGK